MKLKIYGLYNLKDHEQCEYFGTIKEIADYLGLKRNSLSVHLVRKKHGNKFLILHKYELVEMEGIDEIR